MTSSTHRVSRQDREEKQQLDKKLAAYFASAGFAAVAGFTSQASAAVSSSGPLSIKFGPANGGPGNIDIPIDLDGEGELEFLLRHKTNTIGENYLELDKSPDEFSDFPDNNFDGNNGDWGYVVSTLGDYPAALTKGTFGGTFFTPPVPNQYEFFQDSSNYASTGTTRRANRLIDYDSGVDDSGPWNPPPGSDGHFLGLGGVTHYVGFSMDFDDAGPLHYGWLGVKITDDATASGELVGFAYETQAATGVTIGHFVPEPTTMVMAGLGGVAIASSWLGRRLRNK